MEWLEISANTVQRAKEEALVHLGVHESDAEFEIVSAGKVGRFGRIKENARVRARVLPVAVRPKESRDRGRRSRAHASRRSSRSQEAPRLENRKVSAPDQRKAAVGSGRPGRGKREPDVDVSRRDQTNMTEISAPGPSLSEQADMAEAFVSAIGETLGLSLSFTRRDLEDGIVRIEAHGEDIGILVGHRGATARAIDELTRTVLQRSGGSTREGKIRVDVGGIRARRAACLVQFVQEVAVEVRASGEEIALEPMSRMDRKIIHDALAELDGVSSRSEGEDPDRHVIVTPWLDD